MRQKTLENIVGKGENGIYPSTDNRVHVAYSFWSANAFNFNKSRILQYGKEFMQNCCNHKPIHKYVGKQSIWYKLISYGTKL